MITKSLAIFLAIFAISIMPGSRSQKHMRYSVLAFKYVGWSDKPITPIVISDSEAGAEWYRTAILKQDKSDLADVHVVNADLLAQLVEEAEVFNREQDATSNSPKTVSVTIITPQKKDSFRYDTGSAISQLKSLQKHFRTDEPLCWDLLHFEKRIRVTGAGFQSTPTVP
jgi:hypothetical protein